MLGSYQVIVKVLVFSICYAVKSTLLRHFLCY